MSRDGLPDKKRSAPQNLDKIQGEKNAAHLAVLGGGISGLTAAYYAMKNGQPASQIVVYDAAGRMGGKIETTTIDNEVVNKCAEFVDSTNVRTLAICKELGLNTIPSTDQQQQSFQHPNGSVLTSEQFLAEYRPLSEQIIKDKQAIAKDPEGDVAKKLDGMSAEEYFNHLLATVKPNHENRTYAKWAWDTITFQGSRVDPALAEIAKKSYMSECGQPVNKISAMQFVMEASGTTDAFLESDCAFRIEGGTERLAQALQKHLEEKGVQFVQNRRLESLSKEDGGLTLNFAENSDKVTSARADKVILALPSYGISKIKGLDALGMSAEDMKTLTETQYSQNIKFTIALKPGAKVPNATFFSNDCFQTWKPKPNQLTFLCTPEGNQKPEELINAALAKYAKAHGLNVEETFDRSPGKVMFNNPGKSPSYAAAAPGQMIKLMRLNKSLAPMSANGVALVGTYFPMSGINGRNGIGFVECGVNSSLDASMRLCPPDISQNRDMGSQKQIPNLASGRPMSRC